MRRLRRGPTHVTNSTPRQRLTMLAVVRAVTRDVGSRAVSQQLSFRRGPAVVAVTLCAGALALGAGLALRGSNNSLPSLPSPPHASQDLSAVRHIGPTLRELQANFAALRRPATAREHALLPTYTAPTNDRPEVPEYVREAGVADGIPVYFVVYPIFGHGASGPVVGYEMSVMANSGFPYTPSNYLIFPAVLSGTAATGLAQPQAYLSVVPDGVRSVRWHFTCHSDLAGRPCELFAHSATVPVHHNLAVLPITTGSGYPVVNRVTWYRTDGSTATFTNQNKAVPFPGAPAWPVA